MPMLPSGRHVAIDRTPFQVLLDDAASPFNVHKVLGICEKADIHPFTEVIWLLPEEQATEAQIDAAFLDGSLPRPPGLVPVRSSHRLSEFETFARDWSEEDKAVFWEFINVRAAYLFQEGLQVAMTVQKLLRTQAEGTTKVMVAWWDAGVHPSQVGTPVREGELPECDACDMLAVIGQMHGFMQTMQLDGRLLDDKMRQTAIWATLTRDVPRLKDWPTLAIAPRAAARAARESQWLDILPAGGREAMHRQFVYECVALWDHFGPRLEDDYPAQFELLNLVALSPETKEYFD